MAERFAVIMAGGSGTRLWPMSRADMPKQLLKLTPEGKSLLRVSIDRLLGLFDYEHIYIIAAENHIEPIAREIPELPADNLIGEPIGRDTANAVGLSAAILSAKYSGATMGIFTADHLIEPVDKFQNALKQAYNSVEQYPEYLATFGVKPTWAHTGLGYIHRGELFIKEPIAVYKVVEFKEKPDQQTAEKYLASGEYYWNSGMFVWKVETILEQLKQHLPANAEKLIELGKAYGGDDWAEKAAKIYPTLEKISIDFAVMEKAENVIVVELDAKWADVGNWTELKNVTGLDETNSAVLADVLYRIDSHDNVIVSSDKGHLISLIGVRDMIVIHTPDAALICPKSESQKIKQLVAELKEKYQDKYV